MTIKNLVTAENKELNRRKYVRLKKAIYLVYHYYGENYQYRACLLTYETLSIRKPLYHGNIK